MRSISRKCGRKSRRQAMASALKAIVLSFLLQCMLCPNRVRAEDPVPTPWPLQFHALIYSNTTGALAFDDLWYDWPNGRNFNILHNQLGSTLHDLEWTNGSSFYYDLELKTCKPRTFPVGILRPDWLQPATYLGVASMDGFTCNVWSKADNFIFYYEDVESKLPVHWLFYTGMSMHVMTFEVGKVLEDKEWQAPAYCFGQSEDAISSKIIAKTDQLLPEQRWLQSLVSLM